MVVIQWQHIIRLEDGLRKRQEEKALISFTCCSNEACGMVAWLVAWGGRRQKLRRRKEENRVFRASDDTQKRKSRKA